MRTTAKRRPTRSLDGLWAILPGHWDQLQYQATMGFPLALPGRPKRNPLVRSPGVAVIDVFGVVCQRFGLSEFTPTGDVSTELLAGELARAERDPSVKSIVFNFDSPGGRTNGIAELAAQIASVKAKRVVASINCLAAAAAYWLACAADEIVMMPSGLVGAVGVLAVHTSTAGHDKRVGIALTVTRKPAHKAEGVAGEALTASAEAYRQHLVESVYGRFVADVALYREVKPDRVRNDFGGGRVMTAGDALAAGLIDRIATFDAVISELRVR